MTPAGALRAMRRLDRNATYSVGEREMKQVLDRSVTFVAVVISLTLSACFNAAAFNQSMSAKVMKRAAFDLGCPETDIKTTELDHNDAGGVTSMGAEGCGKKVTYQRELGTERWFADIASANSESTRGQPQ
jgi:hypothetical protein